MRVLVGSAWVGAVLCVHTTSVGPWAWSIAEGFPLKTDVVGVRPQPQRVLNLVGIGSGLRPDDLGLDDGDDDVCGHIKPRWVFDSGFAVAVQNQGVEGTDVNGEERRLARLYRALQLV